MEKIDKHKLIITIIFFLMAFLNFYKLLDIKSYGVFGLTFGALLICISTCFEGSLKFGKIDIWCGLKNIFYSTGWIFIVVSIYLKDNKLFNGFIEAFDNNTLMLLSLAFTFLSLMVSEWGQRCQKKIIEQEGKKLDELIKEQDKRQEELNRLIKKLNDRKNGRDQNGR